MKGRIRLGAAFFIGVVEIFQRRRARY
jgi:hypothetical protein